MYEQDFEQTLEELIKQADLELDPIEQYEDWEIEEMLEWLRLERFDEIENIDLEDI